jgi:hypothetical protein
MRVLLFLAAWILLVAGASVASGQQQQQQPLVPTTVQLPTFSFFTVQTTVSVPDSGGSYLGGLMRARDGSVTRGNGPLRNRGIGSERGASGMSVHATIIDNSEIDEALLAQAAARRGERVDLSAAKAEALTRQVSRADPSTKPSSTMAANSLAAIREQNAAAAAQRAGEAAALYAKARQAEAEGKPGVAKVYYQMVVRRDSGQLKELARSRLSALSETKAGTVAKR